MRSSIKVSLIAVAITFAFGDVADAGSRDSWPVDIDLFARTAQGSLGSARAGLGLQYIGCWSATTGTDDTTDATYHSGCWARNWYGVTVSCNFPDIQAPFPGIPIPPQFMTSGDALIEFSWDASGVCTELKTSVYASLRPKTL